MDVDREAEASVRRVMSDVSREFHAYSDVIDRGMPSPVRDFLVRLGWDSSSYSFGFITLCYVRIMNKYFGVGLGKGDIDGACEAMRGELRGFLRLFFPNVKTGFQVIVLKRELEDGREVDCMGLGVEDMNDTEMRALCGLLGACAVQAQFLVVGSGTPGPKGETPKGFDFFSFNVPEG